MVAFPVSQNDRDAGIIGEVSVSCAVDILLCSYLPNTVLGREISGFDFASAGVGFNEKHMVHEVDSGFCAHLLKSAFQALIIESGKPVMTFVAICGP